MVKISKQNVFFVLTLMSLLFSSNHLWAKDNWFAAEGIDLNQTPCQGEKNFNSDNLKKKILKKYENNKIIKSVNINGINFADEYSGLLELFKKLTSIKENGSFFLPLNSQKTFNLSDAYCDKVFCAVEEILGKDLGIRLLYLLQKYGLNGASFLFENSSEWTVEEIDSTLKALSDLPFFILPIKKNHKFTHFTRKFGREKLIANATFSFFDEWSRYGEFERRYTVIHELGHYVDSLFDISETSYWKNLIANEFPVSGYSQTNPAENFAESFASFRYNPKQLKKTNLQKYLFMKDVIFAGLDFETEAACQKDKILFLDINKKIKSGEKKGLGLYNLNEAKHCGSVFFQYMVTGNQGALIKCLQNTQLIKTEQRQLSYRSIKDNFVTGRISYLNNSQKFLKYEDSNKDLAHEDFAFLYDKFSDIVVNTITEKWRLWGMPLAKDFQSSAEYHENFNQYCLRGTKYFHQSFMDLEEVFGQSFSYNNRVLLNQLGQKFCHGLEDIDLEIGHDLSKNDVIKIFKKASIHFEWSPS